MPIPNHPLHASAELNLRSLQTRYKQNDTKISAGTVDKLFAAAQSNHEVGKLIQVGGKLLGRNSAGLFEKGGQVKFVDLAFKYAKANHAVGQFFELGGNLQRGSRNAPATAAQAEFKAKAEPYKKECIAMALEGLKSGIEGLSMDDPKAAGLMEALMAQDKAMGSEFFLNGDKDLVVDGATYSHAEVLVHEAKLYVMAHLPTGDAYLDSDSNGGFPVWFKIGNAP